MEQSDACSNDPYLFHSFSTRHVASAQLATMPSEELAKERRALEVKLESIAIIDRKVRIPMRDGTLIAADVYRPKDVSKKYPIIFVRTPYSFNYWDVQIGAPSDLSEVVQAVEHG